MTSQYSTSITFERVPEGLIGKKATSIELTVEQTDAAIAFQREIDGITDVVVPGKLMLTHLAESAKHEDLLAMFGGFGIISEAKIVSNISNGKPCGYGFITFEDPENATPALSCNGMELRGKELKVFLARTGGDGFKRAALYIKGIPLNWTVTDLYHYFEYFGAITSVKLLAVNHVSRGVGFVRFVLRLHAEHAKELLNNKVPDGETTSLRISFTHTSGREPASGNSVNGSEPNSLGSSIGVGNMEPSSNGSSASQHRRFAEYPLFVGNIRRGFTEASLKTLFETAGVVNSVKIMDGGSNEHAGYAFVNMKTGEGAYRAIRDLDGKPVDTENRMQVRPKEKGAALFDEESVHV